MIIDSHAHLTDSIRMICAKEHKHCLVWQDGRVVPRELASADDLPALIRAGGIAASVEPATTFDSNRRILDFCGRHEGVYAACGLHPTRLYVNQRDEDGHIVSTITTEGKYDELEQLIVENSGRISAIKTGLDFHAPPCHEAYQIEWFTRLVDLAIRLDKPLVLHIRAADSEAYRILEPLKGRVRGVVHCFMGGPEVARLWTEELGLCLGIGGKLLLGQDHLPGLEASVRRTLPEKLLLETDSPYVHPPFDAGGMGSHQRAGIINSPLVLPAVARRIAELKGMTEEEVCRVTAENARALFGMKE